MATASAADEKAYAPRLSRPGHERRNSTPTVTEGVAGHALVIHRLRPARSPLAIAPSLTVGVLIVREPLGPLAVRPRVACPPSQWLFSEQKGSGDEAYSFSGSAIVSWKPSRS